MNHNALNEAQHLNSKKKLLSWKPDENLLDISKSENEHRETWSHWRKPKDGQPFNLENNIRLKDDD